MKNSDLSVRFVPRCHCEGARARGNLMEQNSLEITEGSPQSHTLLRDDMRYTKVRQQFDKYAFKSRLRVSASGGLLKQQDHQGEQKGGQNTGNGQ